MTLQTPSSSEPLAPLLLNSGAFALEVSQATGKIVGLRFAPKGKGSTLESTPNSVRASNSTSLRSLPSGVDLESLEKNQRSNLLIDADNRERAVALQGPSEVPSDFNSSEAWGGDECFPTIAGNTKPWLRDHGMVWSQPVYMQHSSETHIASTWDVTLDDSARGSFFERTIRSLSSTTSVPGAGSSATPGNSLGKTAGVFEFEMKFPKYQTCNAPEPFLLQALYSSHALFNFDTGDTFTVFRNNETFFTRTVPGAEQHEADKKYFSEASAENLASPAAHNSLRAILVRKSLGVQIEIVCEKGLPHLGVWWCNNGWGDGRPHRTIGIEPTNFASDGPLFLSGSPENTAQNSSITASQASEIQVCKFSWRVSFI